jgi:hypothetical protein
MLGSATAQQARRSKNLGFVKILIVGKPFRRQSRLKMPRNSTIIVGDVKKKQRRWPRTGLSPLAKRLFWGAWAFSPAFD